MAGREDYEEHRQARIDHMKDRAEKATARSSEYGAEFDRMMEAIPFGQPIIHRTRLPHHGRYQLPRAGRP